MARLSTVSTRTVLELGVCVAGLSWCVWRAAVAPISSPEAALYNHLVRVPALDAVVQQDGWSGIVYAVAARRAVNLLKLSEFTLRLPSILAAMLYLWLVYRLSQKHLLALALAIYPIATGVFVSAGGGGLASALCLGALSTANWSLAGWELGLALATAPAWWWMPAGVAVFRLGSSRECLRWAQQVAIPAMAAPFIILLIPLVHAGVSEPAPPGSPSEMKIAMALMRTNAGGRGATIGVSPSLMEQALFYKAEYRERAWKVVPAGAEAAGYLVLDSADRQTGGILFQGASVVVRALPAAASQP
jgi:hypothetical protein